MQISAFDIAHRLIDIEEIKGGKDHPLIQFMLNLDGVWEDWDDVEDEIPWCSAFMNFVAWLLRLPRSKSLRARSWLFVGKPVELDQAEVGFDVVIIKRGKGEQPGPDVLKAPGHVGLFAGWDHELGRIAILGGNQGDAVNITYYPDERLLGIRRLI